MCIRDSHSADPNECPPAPRLRSRSRMVEVDPLPEAGAASTPEAADGAGGSAAPSGPAHHTSPIAAGDRVDESPEVLSGEDLVLSLGLALLSLLLDPNGVIAAIQSDGGEEERPEVVRVEGDGGGAEGALDEAERLDPHCLLQTEGAV